MKKSNLLLVFLIFFCLFSQAEKKITIVTEAWPPYVFEENGVLKGFDYEVVKEVFKSIGYEVELELLPWKRCISMIERKTADAILDISINDERKKTMYFTDEILSESNSVLFFKKGKEIKFTKLEDLKGKIVGVSLGYNYSEEFDNATYFKKIEAETNQQNFQKLLLDRLDCVVMNKNVGLYEAKKMNILDKISYSDKAVSSGNLYIAFSMKEENKILVEKFDKALKNFKTTKEYKNILSKYGQ